MPAGEEADVGSKGAGGVKVDGEGGRDRREVFEG